MKKNIPRLGIEPQNCKMSWFETWCLSPLDHQISIWKWLIYQYINIGKSSTKPPKYPNLVLFFCPYKLWYRWTAICVIFKHVLRAACLAGCILLTCYPLLAHYSVALPEWHFAVQSANDSKTWWKNSAKHKSQDLIEQSR